MPRDERAYLADIIDSCDAIAVAVRGLELKDYETNRLVRSSVEREFIIIGEAMAALSQAPSIPSRVRAGLWTSGTSLPMSIQPWITLLCGRSSNTMFRCFAKSQWH